MELSWYQIKTIINSSSVAKSQQQNVDTNFVLYDTMKAWYLKFKNKDYDIQEGSGLLTDVDEVRMWGLVEKDQYSTTQELAKELNISDMSISYAMHSKNLMYKFNCWVHMSWVKQTCWGLH